jgi:crotonobetainyl-CoA:carnitine CoA-transferase CaiB-like acyl-CoA transferase
MGLTAAELQRDNPGLILCDISGYGNDGPYRDKKAYDLLIQSEAGFLSVTGTPDTPSKAGSSIADIAAGMYAYSNILAALLQRQKTGLGSSIDVSMLESLGEWMSYPLYYAYQGASPPQRSGAANATIYPYGPFKAGDGATVMLGLQNEREWLAFCEVVLENPALASDVRFDKNSKRHEHRDALAALIEACFSKFTSEQVIAKLDDAQIANARQNDMSGVWNHPQLAARNRWVSVNSPAGPIPAMLPPGVNDQFDYRMDAIPSVGQHTDAILTEIGLNPDQIKAMKASKAI